MNVFVSKWWFQRALLDIDGDICVFNTALLSRRNVLRYSGFPTKPSARESQMTSVPSPGLCPATCCRRCQRPGPRQAAAKKTPWTASTRESCVAVDWSLSSPTLPLPPTPPQARFFPYIPIGALHHQQGGHSSNTPRNTPDDIWS